ncbi:MAG: hypothetical protein HXX10_26475 [Rhodoplanes sp.]|uniref:secretin and TonB N-terminal domain-containing protein n=1 Tax=Rhodoplanes sp. TaxID=1968906 RepID=UPI0017CC39D1|nr:secretin and TonB N-terminal domain-containing protein [Rhodoplanes sp.]NVO17590.1 hypothetical protein [Rhodoplanes sp.]
MAAVLRRARSSFRRAYRAIWLGAIVIASAQVVVAAERRIDFDIPAQPLERALSAFGATSGLQIFFEAVVASGRWSRPVKGSYDRETALRVLLEGSDLTAQVIAADTITITPPPEAAESLHRMKRAAVASYGAIQADLMKALCRDPETRPGAYRVALQYWIDDTGRVSRLRMIGSSGNVERDAAIVRAIRTIVFPVRTRSVPQPVTLAIEPTGPDEFAGCVEDGLRAASRVR